MVALPVAAVAQDEGGGRASAIGITIGKLQTEEQERGDAIFHKNCHLCHISTGQKRELKINASELVGIFKSPRVTDATVRQLVQEGIAKRMPAFRYTLNALEVDDLIAYLKVRQ
jgi:mono/diheme cytochrome c family protein